LIPIRKYFQISYRKNYIILDLDKKLTNGLKIKKGANMLYTKCGRFGLMSKFFGSSQVLYRGMRTRLRKSRTVHKAFRLAGIFEKIRGNFQ
jgi:hypothetical protein